MVLQVTIQRSFYEIVKEQKLIEGPEFWKVHTLLDNVLKKLHAANSPTTKHQGEVISYNYENQL